MGQPTKCDCDKCPRCAKREYDRQRYAAARDEIRAKQNAHAATRRDARREYAKRYRTENAEQVQAEKRRWYEATRETRIAKARASYRANRDKVLARQRRRYADDPDAVLAINRAAAARNPAAPAAAKRRYKQRLRGAPLTVGAEAMLPALLNDPCAYCGRDAGEIDHIDPVVAGGGGDWDNLTAACRSCNAAKGPRPLLLFMAAT